ncbi:MAG: T9SS type A sorting domain-containing protein [Bacteroidales bacterium]|nr:T9SS type A sorting domain-containing protein [Bacteroidales bacterium]
MKKLFSLLALLLLVSGISAQQITLRFTGQLSDGSYMRLDSVLVVNLTRSWTEKLIFPDTMLTLGSTGIKDVNASQVQMDVFPNPFNGTSTVAMQLPAKENVTLQVFNMAGQKVTEVAQSLPAGTHYFDVSLQQSQVYLLTAITSQGVSTTKLVNQGQGGHNAIAYRGTPMSMMVKKLTDKPFTSGDRMQYTGYATYKDKAYDSRQLAQSQRADEEITLIFDMETPLVSTDEVRNVTDNAADVLASVLSDGGTAVRTRGVCWSTSHNPVTSDFHTTDGSGVGSFVSHLTDLVTGLTYYVRAYAVNDAGTAYGDELSFTTSAAAFECGRDFVKDFDKNEYQTVVIGNQCWMKENLRSEHYADGTEIPLGVNTANNTLILSPTDPYRYVPGDHIFNVTGYGYLYNWRAAMHKASANNSNPSGIQGVCPNGWHLPSKAEWEQMFSYLRSDEKYWCNGDSNNIARALASTSGWPSGGGLFEPCSIDASLSSNNASGFSALPAGMVYEEWGTRNFGTNVYFWSTTVDGSSIPYYLFLSSGSVSVSMYAVNNRLAVSVRCIHDNAMSDTTFNCGVSTIKDVDGNEYHTLRVGERCWLKENMRTLHYSDGKAIEVGTAASDTSAFCYYPAADGANVDKYGLLYNWAAVMNGVPGSNGTPSGVQGVCPAGWHVPSDAEWTNFITYVSSQGSFACNDNTANIAKALASESGWAPFSGEDLPDATCFPGVNASYNNASGFSIVLAGCYDGTAATQFQSAAYPWSASDNGKFAYYRGITHNKATVERDNIQKTYGYSVRCVR